MKIRRRILDAWLHDLRVGWGERAVRSATAVTSVIARGQVGDLHTIGFHFATDGHQLDDVLAWFRLLATHSRQFRRLLGRGGVIQLAGGWVDGQLHECSALAVAPFDVLRLRLHQQVEHGSRLGRAPGSHIALVVIETDGSAGATERAIHHARQAFHTGETMAVTPSAKLLILVRRDQGVRPRAIRVTDAVHGDALLHGVRVRVWVEPLAMSAEHVDSHLLGLAS